MKNTETCPKCNSREIIKIPGKAGAYGSGNNILWEVQFLVQLR